MLKPIRPTQIMDVWARKPLDFDPGTKWQYSNTNYVIAGAIVEKLAGKPLMDLLTERVFTPLQMKSGHQHRRRPRCRPAIPRATCATRSGRRVPRRRKAAAGCSLPASWR